MAYAWFVIPVQPGLLSQVIGTFTGSHGSYRVEKTVVGNPLYERDLRAGYGPPYTTYPAAAAAARRLAATAKANTTPGIIPGEQPGAADTSVKPALSWALSARGLAGWFFRGLKILFGGILVILGVARLTGADNAVTKLAMKAPGAALL
jgi:hypothetical protein